MKKEQQTIYVTYVIFDKINKEMHQSIEKIGPNCNFRFTCNNPDLEIKEFQVSNNIERQEMELMRKDLQNEKFYR